MAGGLDNTTGETMQLKTIQPLAGGVPFPDVDKEKNFRIVDGFGGAEPLEWGATAYTAVHRGNGVMSRNNLLMTFGENKSRHSFTAGGLTYADYEKFAQIRQPRRIELETGPDGQKSLECYLDLAGNRIDKSPAGPVLKLLEGEFEEHPHFGRFWCSELSTYAVAKDRVILEASGLNPDQAYTLGFSWWNMEKRSPKKQPRVQSIILDQGPDTPRHVLLDKSRLPLWSDPEKLEAEQAEIPLPREAYANGKMRNVVERVEGDPRVAISEFWLRDGSATPLLPAKPTPINECRRPRLQYDLRLHATDPVGKRVNPGMIYLPTDRFYLDFVTRNPFESLELYGRSIRKAQKISVSVDLAGNTAEGALGLDPTKSYHVYDFWNDHYVGTLRGSGSLEQRLRPNEARMMSVREVLSRPQVISTDRHLMQGLLELDQITWDAGARVLSGTVRLPAGDAVTITLATNGFEAFQCSADEPVGATLDVSGAEEGLAKLRVTADDGCVAKWQISFRKQQKKQ